VVPVPLAAALAVLDVVRAAPAVAPLGLAVVPVRLAGRPRAPAVLPLGLAAVAVRPAAALVALAVAPLALAVPFLGLAVVPLEVAVVPVGLTAEPVGAHVVRLAPGGKRRRGVPGRPGRLAVLMRCVGAGRAVRAHVLGRVRLIEVVVLVRPELAAGRAAGLHLAAAPRPGPADIRTGLRARPGPATAAPTTLTALTGRAALIAQVLRGDQAALIGRAALTARIPPTVQAATTGRGALIARVPLIG
jgi:hypothetical protein